MSCYKLSIFSKNKSFQLKNIYSIIEFEDGQKFKDNARNMRKVTFNGNEELQVLGKDYINNLSFLPANTNIEGYLFFSFPLTKKDLKIQKISFIFESYSCKTSILECKEDEINGQQLFYDDSIWKKLS